MRNFRKHLAIVMVSPSSLVAVGDDAPMVTIVNSQVYDLGAVGNSGISGTAKFIGNSDATFKYRIRITKYSSRGSHPAHHTP
jgi:hypothetical protein